MILINFSPKYFLKLLATNYILIIAWHSECLKKAVSLLMIIIIISILILFSFNNKYYSFLIKNIYQSKINFLYIILSREKKVISPYFV